MVRLVATALPSYFILTFFCVFNCTCYKFLPASSSSNVLLVTLLSECPQVNCIVEFVISVIGLLAAVLESDVGTSVVITPCR